MENRLRVLCAEHKRSQADLAEKLGVSRQTINAIETERGDRFEEIRELNEAYELERSQHLEYERSLQHGQDHERTHDYGYDLDY